MGCVPLGVHELPCASEYFYGERREYPPLRGTVSEKSDNGQCSQVHVHTKLQLSCQKPGLAYKLCSGPHLCKLDFKTVTNSDGPLFKIPQI